jgi:hypothetical protein
VVERPEDVRGRVDVEARAQRALGVEALHDAALVGVKLGLNPPPERTDLRIPRRSGVDHLHDRARALLHGA